MLGSSRGGGRSASLGHSQDAVGSSTPTGSGVMWSEVAATYKYEHGSLVGSTLLSTIDDESASFYLLDEGVVPTLMVS